MPGRFALLISKECRCYAKLIISDIVPGVLIFNKSGEKYVKYRRAVI